MRILLVMLAVAVALISGQAVAATLDQWARQWLKTLDAAVETGNQVAQSGDPGRVAAHGRYLRTLLKDGERFGKTALDQPYGSCFKAGISINGWWGEVVNVGSSGKESIPGRLDQVIREYADARMACEEAVQKEETKKK
jgi:hypothetical protein